MDNEERQIIDKIKAEMNDPKRRHELSEWIGERALSSILLRRDRFTFKQMGEKLNVSGCRARQIYLDGLRRYESVDDPRTGLEALPLRIRYCLRQVEIFTEDQARRAILNGVLYGATYRGRKINRFSKKSFWKLCDHLGIEYNKEKVPKTWIERAIRLLEKSGYEVKKITEDG